MLIDWFTVVAQAANFLVLVWLLKRFLYKPILGAMDARENRIASQLRQAEADKVEAKKEGEKLRAAREEFERNKQARLKDVSEEVNAMRHQLSDQARHEIDNLRAEWRATLEVERKTLLNEIADRVQQETLEIASKALRDLAGREVEQWILEVFLRKLRDLNGAEKKNIASIANSSESPILVRTAFDLSSSMRAEIEKSVKSAFASSKRVEFEKASELIGGIELIGNGRKISWSIGDYLSSLQQNLHEIIDQEPAKNESAD
jgi:F-type H+-transporting ATPase subunit b